MKTCWCALKYMALLTFIAVALCAAVVAVPFVTAKANSAQKDWSGSKGSGALVTDENCPVTVESELLTFNVNEFPQIYEQTEDELSEYGASVTASYSFYNPADYTVDMNLVFPFGTYPDYFYFDTGELDDTQKYEITVDGEKAERKLRHTYCGYYEFSADEDIAKIRDGYAEDGFFSPHTEAVKYTFKFENIGSSSERGQAYYEFEIYLPQGARAFGSLFGYEGKADDTKVRGWVSEGDVYDIYVVGSYELPRFDCKFYKDAHRNVKTHGNVGIINSYKYDFESLALSFRDENSTVSDIDWYNAVLDAIKVNSFSFYKPDGRFLPSGFRLMRWYEYSLTLAPGERVVNEVSAPVYPDINGYYTPSVFTYRYLLSPAKCWAEFGDFEVIINTPYYLLDGSLEGMEKTEFGYRFSAETLPDGELDFTLCASENPARDKSGFGLYTFIIIMLTLPIVYLAALFITAVVLAVMYIRRKKQH